MFLEGPVYAFLTIVTLFIAGPLLLFGFIAVLVTPFILFALRSKVRDPEGLPNAPKSSEANHA